MMNTNKKNREYNEAIAAMHDFIVTSGVDGKIPDIVGLDEGQYSLREVVTPPSYNTMPDPTFKIEPFINDVTGKLEKVDFYYPADAEEPLEYSFPGEDHIAESGMIPQSIVNEQAPFLPFTGGIGAGVIIAISAVIVGVGIFCMVVSRHSDNGPQKPDGGDGNS